MPDLPEWQVLEYDSVPRLVRVFPFKRYLDGVAFANQIAALADQQDHHPSLLIEWRRVTVSWFTHSIGGLHRNDLIMAARTDQIFHSQKPAQS
jgi:4a-hydroxytetrahydrobiopterin dehydratase